MTFLVVLVVLTAGCGSTKTAAAEKACDRMWGPHAKVKLTEARMIDAAGKPDKVERSDLKDLYGDPMGWKNELWNDGHGTAITFGADGEAVAAICNLAGVPAKYR